MKRKFLIFIALICCTSSAVCFTGCKNNNTNDEIKVNSNVKVNVDDDINVKIKVD